jgi:hypothetical protein
MSARFYRLENTDICFHTPDTASYIKLSVIRYILTTFKIAGNVMRLT